MTANELQSLDAAKMNLSSLGLPGFAAKLDTLGRVTSPVVGDISKATVMASGTSISNKIQDIIPLTSNLRAYTYGDGSAADASLLDNYVAKNCGQAINVPKGYILPTNSDGGAHFPDTSKCISHYTWIYNGKIHTIGGTPTDFRTEDDLHIDMEGGAIGLAKTKKNTTSSDPQMVYIQYVNNSTGASSASSTDPTKLSMAAIEENVQAAPGSEGSMLGLNVDLTDNSTTGDNANVGLSSNVYKNSSINKDWGISVAGYDFSVTQPQNTISYTGIENDVQVNGQDMGASLWDSTQGGRHLMWLGANTVQHPYWQPKHLYNIGDKIVDANKNWIWVVTKAGTSSAGTDPTKAWQPASGFYTDGTVTFQAKIDYHGVVSKAIYVINDHVDSDYSFFDDVLAVNANVRDSSINLTKEILTQPHSASIRLSKNHPIDFSGDATPAGKNQIVAVAREKTIVGKIGLGSSWNIEMNSKPALIVENRNLALNSAGLVRLSISDSAKLKPETLASPVGLTVGHSLFTPDRTDIIYGKNGADILGTNTYGYPHKEPIISLPDKAYREGGKQAVAMGAPLRLLNMSRSEIKNYPAPIIGMEIYDIDDDVPAVYTKKGWKLMLLSDFPSK